MVSLILSKYNVGVESPIPIDPNKYRDYINGTPNYFWKENVDEFYKNIQEGRKLGKINDGIEARSKMDFYFNYKNSNKYDFEGTYYDFLGYIYIKIPRDPKQDILKEVFRLAKILDAFVYKGDYKIDILFFQAGKDRSRTEKNKLKSQLEVLEKDYYKLVKNYPLNYFENCKEINNRVIRKKLTIIPWDLSVLSANNLQSIVIHHVFEGLPIKDTPLDKKFGKKYVEVFSYYVGEIIVKSNNNYYWDYLISENKNELVLINKIDQSVIIPGSIILKLLASDGNLSIVDDIEVEINKHINN